MRGAARLPRGLRRVLARGAAGLRGQRGMILPLTLMFLLILGGLSAAILSAGGNENLIAANHLRATHALFLAEAGLEDAFNTIRNNGSTLTSTSLTTLSGLAGSGLTGVGTYAVSYQVIGTNTWLVVSTGTTTQGSAVRTVKAMLSTAWTSSDAVRTKDSLTISGSAEVEGSCGSVHSNGNLTLSGSPEIDQNATATGTYTTTGSPDVGGSSGGGQTAKTIPYVTPSDVLTSAKNTLPAGEVFQFKSNGQVLNGADTVLTTLSNGQSYNNWTYSSATSSWSLTGNSATNGTYYFEGDATVGGNPGSSATPWQATIITTGNLTVSGNPNISPHLTDTVLISGKDLLLSGNLTAGTGLIAAHEQISITGSVDITGSIVAEDAASTSSLVTANSITGSADIEYACGLNPPLQSALSIVAWGV